MRLPTFFVFSCLFLISELGLTLGREATANVAEMEVDDDGATVSTAGAKPAVSLKTDAQLSPLEETDDLTAFFSKVSTRIHHNGNPNPCGVAPPSLQVFAEAINDLEATKEVLSSDKFAMEAFLTRFFAIQLSRNTSPDTCQPTDSQEDPLHPGLPGFCDMGPQRTVIQHDFDKLVQVPVSKSLPCRFFTREGLRITSLDVLKQVVLRQQEKSGTSNVVDLYAVPAGRMFMFGPSHVGELFELSHVQDTLGRDLVLQTLSLEPRVFDIYHFFSHKESDELVAKALRETSESHRFHRSTTGTTGANVFNKRTSENAWDTHGKTAQAVKKRCFSLLGIDEYVEEMSDGLQILRYNLTTAYTPHMDYLEDRSGKEPYDYETAGKGGNRFATILLYFTDLPEGSGGETVFTRAWPPGLPEEERVPIDQAIKQLRDAGEIDMLEPGSWEEKMAAECRTRLSVKPNATRAVLFYSTFPNGQLDQKSFHGGCPVLKGTKIAANLWTWSGIRPEFEGAPQKRVLTEEEKKKQQSKDPRKVLAVFKNSGKDKRFDNAAVYYDEDGYFGPLGPKDPPVRVNTYKTHVWNIKADGKTLKTFVITDDTQENQEFVV